jgi:D-ribose pyranose/furanose isomerase RbsD
VRERQRRQEKESLLSELRVKKAIMAEEIRKVQEHKAEVIRCREERFA